MKSTRYRTTSEEETIALGAELVRGWTLPAVVSLSGNLGAGKTTLVKGMAEGLGAAGRNDVSSPTFPLIHEYGENGEMAHVDLYRLDTVEEVESLGLEEVIARASLTVLEWAERFSALLPAGRIEIRIDPAGENERQIEVIERP